MFLTVFWNAVSGSYWWILALTGFSATMGVIGYTSYYVDAERKIVRRYKMMWKMPAIFGLIIFVLFWSETTLNIQGWLDLVATELHPGLIAQPLLYWGGVALAVGVLSCGLLFVIEIMVARIRFQILSAFNKSWRKTREREKRRLKRTGDEE